MLATVGRYLNPWEAHILRARLEAEGIPARVTGDQHVIANWTLSVALGGVALHVPATHLEQARQIVTAYHAGTLEKELLAEHPEAADSCPACGSTDVAGSVPLRQKAVSVATFLLTSVPCPTNASRMHCRACDHRWWYKDYGAGSD